MRSRGQHRSIAWLRIGLACLRAMHSVEVRERFRGDNRHDGDRSPHPRDLRAPALKGILTIYTSREAHRIQMRGMHAVRARIKRPELPKLIGAYGNVGKPASKLTEVHFCSHGGR
jgi:hypothetical protein